MYTVGIDIEGNLDLRDSSGSGSNTVQTELSEGLIIFGELTLTLYYVDIYCGLIE